MKIEKVTTLPTHYFDIHIMDGKRGYSVAFKMDADQVPDNETILRAAIKANTIDNEDSRYMDSITPIDAEEYAELSK